VKGDKEMAMDSELYALSTEWLDLISRSNYAHDLTYFGTPIFQVPTDIYLYQKLIWDVKPSLVIETGVAKGGSILAISSFMFLAEQHREFSSSSPRSPDWLVVGIDKNSLEEERKMLSRWSFGKNTLLIEGSSIDDAVLNELKGLARNHKNVMIFLDSDHSESHVSSELERYSDLVSVGSYLVVFDSGIGRLSEETHKVRPRNWNSSSHAGTAVVKFLENQESFAEKHGKSSKFSLVSSIAEPLGISSIEHGILRRDY
jgi:cephalosporin hydroxylase